MTQGLEIDPVGLASELPDAAAFERAILGELGRLVGFDAGFFAVKGAEPTTVNLDAEALAGALTRVDYEAEIAPTREAALAARGVAVDTAVLGERAVRRLGYHRDLAAPVGGRHSLLAFLSLRGAPVGGVMLGRCGASFSAGEIALVEALLPRVAVARASYRLPWASRPLKARAEPSPRLRVLDWVRGERTLARVGDEAASIVVRDRGEHREMVSVEGGRELIWSRVRREEPARSGWFYVDLFHLAAARARTRTRALFIGCGGGAALRQFAEVYPGIGIDVVDSDARVVELARSHFGLDEIPQLSVRVGCGVSLVAGAAGATWDVILVDAYDGSEVAAGFASRGFFAGVRRALRPGGCMAFNAIGALGGTGVVQQIERAARAELAEVRLVPVLDPGEAYEPGSLRNVVVLGRRPDGARLSARGA